MTKRAIFSHKYRRLAYIKYLGWCCWCKPGNKREDFLFRDAKEKLNNETDLLEMVKNMRIFKFTSDIILKPRQKDLVNFFDAYKLKETKESEAKKPHEFSKRLQSVRTKRKYTSHGAQGQAPSNVEDLLIESANDAEAGRIMVAVDEADPDKNAID